MPRRIPLISRVAVLTVLCALPGAAAAQELPPLTEHAPVVLDGHVLFEVGESGTWSAEMRAQQIDRLLLAAAASSEPVHLELAEHDGYPTIRMGDWHLLTVADSDVPLGMDAGEQAQRWLMITEAALRQARLERTPTYLAGAWLRVLAVLLLAAVLHFLLSRLSRRLPLLLSRAVRLRPRNGLSGTPAWQTAVEIACVAGQVVVWLRAAVAISEQFPATRQGRFELGRLLGGSLHAALFTINERSYSALDVLWLLGAAVALWIAVSIFTSVLNARLARATGAARGALQPATTLLRYGLIAVGWIVILQVAGLDLSSLALLASVLGVGIGFGLQSIANNFVSGVIISFERPIKPGDFVSVGELQGTVERVGGRSTTIRTLDRVSIIVPNARLLENEVINWSYGDPVVRLHVPIGVAYGSDIARLRAALFDAAKKHPAVLDQPRPEVRFLGFGESTLDFELLVWSSDPPGQSLLKSDLNYQIEANLRHAGIDVPFPQRTLHVPPAEVDALAARLRGEAPAAPPPAPPADTEAVAFPSAPWHGVDLDGLVARMRAPGGLAIEDRRHLLSVYRKCFVGEEAVQWLMRAQDLSRDEAISLGQRLVERGFIHHVLDEHPFRDGNFYYRFYADEEEQSPRQV